MQAELKRIHSPDVLDLEHYNPEPSSNFSFLLQAMIGPMGCEGEEAFDIVVATPEWLRQRCGEQIIIGEHHLIICDYNYATLFDFIARFAEKCVGEDWQTIAKQLSRLGRWEFDDYRPNA
jgi:hypothetical protein